MQQQLEQLEAIRKENKAKFQVEKEKDQLSTLKQEVPKVIFLLQDYLRDLTLFMDRFFEIFPDRESKQSQQNAYVSQLKTLENSIAEISKKIYSFPKELISFNQDVLKNLEDFLAEIKNIAGDTGVGTFSHRSYIFKKLESLCDKFQRIKNHIESLCYEFERKHTSGKDYQLLNLPENALLSISSSLNAKDLSVMTRVNKKGQQIANNSLYWKLQFFKRGIHIEPSSKAMDVNFKTLYKKYMTEFNFESFVKELVSFKKVEIDCFNPDVFKCEIREELQKHITVDRKNAKYTALKIISLPKMLFTKNPFKSEPDHKSFGMTSVEIERASAYFWICNELENVKDLNGAKAFLEMLDNAIDMSSTNNGEKLQTRFRNCKNITQEYLNQADLMNEVKQSEENNKSSLNRAAIQTAYEIIDLTYNQFLKHWENQNTNLYEFCKNYREKLNNLIELLKEEMELNDRYKSFDKTYLLKQKEYDELYLIYLQKLQNCVTGYEEMQLSAPIPLISSDDQKALLLCQIKQNSADCKKAKEDLDQLMALAKKLGISDDLPKLSAQVNKLFVKGLTVSEKIEIIRKNSPQVYDQMMQTLQHHFPEQFLNHLLTGIDTLKPLSFQSN